MSNIVILDTACANLSSVVYALQRLGYQPRISRDPQQIAQADRIIFPGVGHAAVVMQQLQPLLPVLRSCKQPLLGICLGMQVLGSQSDEGRVPLLSLIDNTPIQRLNSQGQPLPHSGWNQVIYDTEHPLFYRIPSHSTFYFVHSYAMALCPQTLARTLYGESFTAAVQQNNFYGVQFHPERSGAAGAQLLKNFMEII
ncbi:MAG: imidazole glycerol phosphate synthase subunit HisH [Enterobacteriaceae bacterium]